MDAMSSSAGHRIETAHVRRAPRYGVFLVGGAVLGVIVAGILTLAFAGDPEKSPYTGVLYSDGQVFGFVALICVPIGLALGGVVALLLDRLVGRKLREVRVDHETVVEATDPGA
jgi:MFS family permease